MQAVEEVFGFLSPHEYRRRFHNQVPVVMRGAMLPLVPGLALWGDAGYVIGGLTHAHGGDAQTVTVMHATDHRRFMDNDIMVTKSQMRIGDVLAKIGDVQQPRVYLRHAILPGIHGDALAPVIAAVQQMIDGPGATPLNASLCRLWIGSAGNCTPLHYDRCHGVLGQLTGTKRFVLVDPEDTSNVYPHSSTSPAAHGSRVDVAAWANEATVADARTRFPKFERAVRYFVDLQPGDCLITPAGWWHDVTSTSPSISVTVPFNLFANDAVPAHFL